MVASIIISFIYGFDTKYVNSASDYFFFQAMFSLFALVTNTAVCIQYCNALSSKSVRGRERVGTHGRPVALNNPDYWEMQMHLQNSHYAHSLNRSRQNNTHCNQASTSPFSETRNLSSSRIISAWLVGWFAAAHWASLFMSWSTYAVGLPRFLPFTVLRVLGHVQSTQPFTCKLASTFCQFKSP